MNRVIELQEIIINIMKDECGCKPRWLYSNPGWNQIEWLEETIRELTTPEDELRRENQSWFEEVYLAEDFMHTDPAWLIQADLEK
jgi:hypothetical protein